VRHRLLRLTRSRRTQEGRSIQTTGQGLTLPRALAALAEARVQAETDHETLVAAFTAAVERLDAADRAYRVAIEAALPAEKSHSLLEAMAAYRNGVAEVRERTRTVTNYGDYDPLDTYVPSIPASHAHAVRAANEADIARAEVAHRRAQINAHVAESLDKAEIERLIEAKRVRNAAFDRAIRAAVPSGTSDHVATNLLLLADGWY
jgi:hypothetical protein